MQWCIFCFCNSQAAVPAQLLFQQMIPIFIHRVVLRQPQQCRHLHICCPLFRATAANWVNRLAFSRIECRVSDVECRNEFVPSALRMTSMIEFTFEGTAAAAATTPITVELTAVIGAASKRFAVFTFRIGFTWLVATDCLTDGGVLTGLQAVHCTYAGSMACLLQVFDVYLICCHCVRCCACG